MPKVKTNSSAKKRFHLTGTGEIVYQKQGRRHNLSSKSKKRKRVMRSKNMLGFANKGFVRHLLGLG